MAGSRLESAGLIYGLSMNLAYLQVMQPDRTFVPPNRCRFAMDAMPERGSGYERCCLSKTQMHCRLAPVAHSGTSGVLSVGLGGKWMEMRSQSNYARFCFGS